VVSLNTISYRGFYPPYNDVFQGGCFYNEIFSVLGSMRRSPLGFFCDFRDIF